MPVDTRKVTGRRQVRYGTFEDVVADGERLAALEVASLGNWSLGQTLKHLGAAMEGSINGSGFKVRLWLRIVGRLYVKRLLLNGPFPTGFQLPGSVAKRLVPGETSPADGLDALRRGIARLRSETTRGVHPVAGPLSIEEWNRFHLRHSEMHMSFLVPKGAAGRSSAACDKAASEI